MLRRRNQMWMFDVNLLDTSPAVVRDFGGTPKD